MFKIFAFIQVKNYFFYLHDFPRGLKGLALAWVLIHTQIQHKKSRVWCDISNWNEKIKCYINLGWYMKMTFVNLTGFFGKGPN